MIKSVICSAEDGSNADVPFYQNNIQLQNFVEKVWQNFEKKTLQATIRKFQAQIQQQDDGEIRATYGSGSYRVVCF